MTEDPPRLDGFDQELPRRVQLRVNVASTLWVITAGFASVLAFTLLISYFTTRQMSELMWHGVHVRGVVSSLVIRGKRGNIFELAYCFTDPTPPDPVEAFQLGKTDVTEAQFYRLYLGARIDIVFLPLRPDISRPGFQIPKRTQDVWLPLKTAITAVVLVGAGGALAFTWTCWRERRLLQWGQHTLATVKSVWIEKTGDYPTTMTSFEFMDAAGVTRQSVTHSFPASIRKLAIGDTVIALYDPLDPARADLYPLRLLMLACGSDRPEAPSTPVSEPPSR